MKKTLILIVSLLAFTSLLWAQSQITETNGNVGIGTINPTSKLHIADGVGGNQLSISRGSGTVVFAQDAGKDNLYLFNRDGSKMYMFWRENGNVGIGTYDPQKALDIQGGLRLGISPSQYADLHFQEADVTETGYFNHWPDQYERAFMVKPRGYLDGWGAGGAGIQFYTYDIMGGSSPNFTGGFRRAMVIRRNGNVGIGTASPTARLEVDGNVKIGTDNGELTGYGATLQFLGAAQNGDPLWLSRYNNGSNNSELRVNIGDDYGQSEDMFVVGTHHWNGGAWNPHFAVQASGNVGIGTTSPDSKLTVDGAIHSQKVKVTVNAGADFVFEEGYDLRKLEDLQKYIQQHKHLPDIPSAKEMETKGLELGEMNIKLLQKIEELTLYILEQNKKIEQLQKDKNNYEELKKEIEQIKKMFTAKG